MGSTQKIWLESETQILLQSEDVLVILCVLNVTGVTLVAISRLVSAIARLCSISSANSGRLLTPASNILRALNFKFTGRSNKSAN